MRLDLWHLLDHLDHLPWWKALSLGVSAGVLLAVVGLDLLGGWWGLGIGVAVLGGVVALCWEVEPLLVLEGVDRIEEKTAPIPVAVFEFEAAGHGGVAFTATVDFLGDGLLPMVALDAGSFLMGSPEDDDQGFSNERPQHEVTVSAFFLSKITITRELYRKLMDKHPSQWDRDTDDGRLPANYLSWFDAVRFCNRLSERADLEPCYEIDGEKVTWNREADGYRLPTEAEWEYACRAGTMTRWYWGDEETGIEEHTWYAGNADDRVHPVAEKRPNRWGLHDMAGNVLEWCWDWPSSYAAVAQTDPTGPPDGTYRVLRGGAFHRVPRRLRSACRFGDVRPEDRSWVVGFRVACSRRQP